MASQLKTVLALAIVSVAFFGQQHQQVDALEPLVDTGVSRVSPEGRHVAVHVPGFFNMNLDTRGSGQGARLSQSVMSGLVSVYMDRQKQGDKFEGPIKVRLAGFTIYNNGQPELATSLGDDSSSFMDGISLLPGMGGIGNEIRDETNRARDTLRREGSQISNRIGDLMNRANSEVQNIV